MADCHGRYYYLFRFPINKYLYLGDAMKNVNADWAPSDPVEQVTEYQIYHGKQGGPMARLATTTQDIAVLYPEQLGYVIGDVLQVAVSAVNATGEGPLSDPVSVTLPAELPLPSKVTGLVLTLV